MEEEPGGAKGMVRIAVIGCGYWGKNYVRILHQSVGITCPWCCDSSEDTHVSIRSVYKDMRFALTVEDLLKESEGQIDAAIVALPASMHHDAVISCLQAGLHVLVEKPMALSSSHCTHMIALAAEKKLCLLVGHTFLYNSRVSKALELMNDEKTSFGVLHTIYSTRTNLGPIRSDTSVIWDLAPHDVSIFQYIMKVLPTCVSCTSNNFISENADTAFLTLYYPKNVIAHAHVSWVDPQKERSTVLVGTGARIRFDDTVSREPVKVYLKGFDPEKKDAATLRSRPMQPFRDGDIWSPALVLSEPLKNQVNDFVHCIRSGTKSESGGQIGLDIVRILEAAEKSSRMRGTPVQL